MGEVRWSSPVFLLWLLHFTQQAQPLHFGLLSIWRWKLHQHVWQNNLPFSFLLNHSPSQFYSSKLTTIFLCSEFRHVIKHPLLIFSIFTLFFFKTVIYLPLNFHTHNYSLFPPQQVFTRPTKSPNIKTHLSIHVQFLFDWAHMWCSITLKRKRKNNWKKKKKRKRRII